MIVTSFRSGIQAARSRPGLVVLIWAVNLVLSLIVVMPLTLSLTQIAGDSGFGTALASGLDVAVWADIIREGGAVFTSVLGMFFRIAGIMLLWKVASSVGLIHALGMGGGRSFWQGLGRWTGRGLLVALFYLLGIIGVTVAIVVVSVILTSMIPGEQATFWIPWVISPILLVLGLAFVDLMHDWARMELVLGNTGSVDAALGGLKWPFRSAATVGLYSCWFLVSVVVLFIPAWMEWSMGGLWGGFLIQQVFLLGRAGVTVAWFGSQVTLFERLQAERAPLIADEMAISVDSQYEATSSPG